MKGMSTKKKLNKGAWTEEEDRKLAEVIAVHGARRWNIVADQAALNRCGKSCRLRWLNYLRPNIKRGNISDQEEDLIVRLHKLLGNRWSLIAGRLPGRTDNEIKNYWNSHLSKKINNKNLKLSGKGTVEKKVISEAMQENPSGDAGKNPDASFNMDDFFDFSNENPVNPDASFNMDDFFDFSNENPVNLEWINEFLYMNN